MPYLDPELVLRRFSSYAIEEIRPALKEDEAFTRGQVGSMASTLRFLAGEVAGGDEAVATQADALRQALDDASARVEDESVAATLAEAHDRVAGCEDEAEPERIICEAANDALAAVDTLPAERARRARRPLYDFLETRVTAQLELLGRPPADG